MRGTVLCGIDDVDAGRGALELAGEVSEKLGLRLVVAFVVDGIPRVGRDGDEGATTRDDRPHAARLVTRLLAEHDLSDRAERRSAVGDPLALLSQIAAEEGADMIVVGSRARGRLRRGLESRLADLLETATPLPVLIAPPPRRRARTLVA